MVLVGMNRRTLGLGLLLLTALSSGCHSRKKIVIEDNQKLLEHAQNLISRRRLLEAVQVLGDVGLVTPVAETLDPKIKLALADAYFYQGGTVNVVEAQGRYEQFMSFYPTHPSASYARYQIGACLFEQSQRPANDQEYPRRALDHFNAMVKDLPADDPWGMAARVMVAKAQDTLAEHEWLVGVYYLQRKRYAGAIGRFSALIEKFPAAHRREDAFYRLGEAYEKSGDKEQAQLTWRRSLAEYPEGEHVSELKTKLGT